MPEEMLHIIFILVVLQDGDPALHALGHMHKFLEGSERRILSEGEVVSAFSMKKHS